MIFNLKNEYEVPRFKEYAERLLREGAVVELKKKNPLRSLSQNAYLHVILSYFACETGYSESEVKVDIFKRLCNKEIFERRVTNKRGETVKALRSSADLDTAEMTTAIDRFRNYASAQLGIYLPSPEDHQMLVFAQQEVERNKAYL